MTAAEIAREIERVLDFPSNRKHEAIAIDAHVLREAVRELKAAAALESALTPDEAWPTVRISGGAAE